MALRIEPLLHKQLVLWTDNLSGGKVREQIDSEAIGSQQSAKAAIGRVTRCNPPFASAVGIVLSGKLAGRKGWGTQRISLWCYRLQITG